MPPGLAMIGAAMVEVAGEVDGLVDQSSDGTRFLGGTSVVEISRLAKRLGSFCVYYQPIPLEG